MRAISRGKRTVGLVLFLLGLLSPVAEPADTRPFFQQAVEAFNHQNFESAYDFYRVVLEENPSHLEARSGLWLSAINLGESVEKIQAALKAELAENPRDYKILFSLGVMADLENNPDAAVPYYEAALTSAPEPAEIYLALLNLKLKYTPDDPAVFHYLEELARKGPESYLNFVGQARYYLFLAEKEPSPEGAVTKLNLAMRVAREAQSRRPYSITPYYFLSSGALMAGNLEQTKELLTRAIALAPLDSRLHMMLATVYLQEGNFEEARQHFVIAKKSLTALDRMGGYDRSIETLLKITKTQDRVKPWVYHIAAFLILIFSVILHEYMHGWVAFKRGDQTARALGRLSLNPLVHIDWFGSVFLPLALLLSRAQILVGWAKPVPVNPGNYKNPRWDDALVSLAGPGVNILIAFIFGSVLGVLGYYLKSQGYVSYGFSSLGSGTIIAGGHGRELLLTYGVNICKYGMVMNMFLAGLNLLPVPPLDGSHILRALLPWRWLDRIFAWLGSFGLFLVALLVFSGILQYLLLPVFIVLHVFLVTLARFYGLG
ncbi:MAG TPA: site-2 protease family protein [Candidatus Omnitrophota bacterium]|mgnify:CR=1 FL=1|nr:tetratricopeptide repeat protein [Candidatus Omnitrophota bacterium]HQO58043.1 site-2 protease family protein [Candidatus Omnitrophota bacterium]HQP11297.1 site-2 protease family protein [Candidatus Omnitrophota bacterium]